MRNFFKKNYPITLAIWPYMYFLLSYVIGKHKNLYMPFVVIYIILTIAIYLSNIIYACLYKGEDSYYRLAFWNMLIKLIHIPFYLLTFLSAFILLCAVVVPALTFVAPFAAAWILAIDVCLMVTSSVYGVNALVRAGAKRAVSIKYAVINAILHFFFVADVISSIILFINVRKAKKQIEAKE